VRIEAFIDREPKSLLDVGCNVGAWLAECRRRWPEARLAGIEPNASVLEIARQKLPDADLRVSGADQLPFPDGSFGVATCVEVLEHVPAELRRAAFREIHRVLEPEGRLVLTVPHAGWFAFLDSNNVRFHLPKLYAALAGRGLRDAHASEVEWHHHFSVAELLDLAGDRFRVLTVRYGSLFIAPLMDWASWPFYRAGRSDHWLRRACERAAVWDTGNDYGPASSRVLLALERIG
jgi:SAM-dependent methyltransferase